MHHPNRLNLLVWHFSKDEDLMPRWWISRSAREGTKQSVCKSAGWWQGKCRKHEIAKLKDWVLKQKKIQIYKTSVQRLGSETLKKQSTMRVVSWCLVPDIKPYLASSCNEVERTRPTQKMSELHRELDIVIPVTELKKNRLSLDGFFPMNLQIADCRKNPQQWQTCCKFMVLQGNADVSELFHGHLAWQQRAT